MGFARNIDSEKKEMNLLRDKARLDSMTGMMKKMEAFEDIGKYIKLNPDKLGAFLIFDIDDFKDINDTYGHDIGDKVIKYLAESISSVFRKNDITARFGGDEFFVFMKDLRDYKVVRKRAVTVVIKDSKDRKSTRLNSSH